MDSFMDFCRILKFFLKYFQVAKHNNFYVYYGKIAEWSFRIWVINIFIKKANPYAHRMGYILTF